MALHDELSRRKFARASTAKKRLSAALSTPRAMAMENHARDWARGATQKALERERKYANASLLLKTAKPTQSRAQHI